MKIAFIGSGNMATALMSGLIAKGIAPSDILAVDLNQEALARCHSRYGVSTAALVQDAPLHDYDVIVLAVKPQVLRSVAADIAPFLKHQLILSIAAGIRMHDLSRWLGDYQNLVRTMPNTPAQIGLGATGLVALPGVNTDLKNRATDIMKTVGATVWVDGEAQLDAVTAVSGSGPAYVFYFIEALCEAGVQMGLNAEQAKSLAVATFIGSSQLAAQSDAGPAALREQVTSKGGTTAAALLSFDSSSIKQLIINGAIAAQQRAAELGNELGAP